MLGIKAEPVVDLEGFEPLCWKFHGVSPKLPSYKFEEEEAGMRKLEEGEDEESSSWAQGARDVEFDKKCGRHAC